MLNSGINEFELYDTLYTIFIKGLKDNNRLIPSGIMKIIISAQGGVGTAEEHNFLVDHYKIDSVGWGTPFLLVPEVTTVDAGTLQQLIDAKEDDLYLSDTSPLGIPFNCLKGNTKDAEKQLLIKKGKPGSSCPKKYVELTNREFTEKSICTASRQYQNLKIKELKTLNLSDSEYAKQYEKIVEKACICVGLGTAALIVNNISTKKEGLGVSICPGPNLAYFSKVMSLSEITSHIYGRINIINRTDRPNIFIKELNLYLNYLKNKIEEAKDSSSTDKYKYFVTFSENLSNGIDYYYKLFNSFKDYFSSSVAAILSDLNKSRITCITWQLKLKN